MPILVFKSVHSFTSEDPSFPASNLLSSATSTGKKWKCKSAGEKSVEVVLALEKPSTITAIDIGNEHSAFVEVSVSKYGSSEFQQILLISSFMSPVESRNSDPVNRVRCFSKSALVEEVVESKCKWDLVKIVCSQPFNKGAQYGLSFIKVHSTDAREPIDGTNEISSIPPKLFGNFKIREDSPDSDSETGQSLFARWKGARNSGDGKGLPQSTVPLSAAAAIRNASSTTSLKNHSSKVHRTTVTPKRFENRSHVTDQTNEEEVNNKKNRNRFELMYEDEDDKPNEKLDKILLKERERLEREKSEKKNSSSEKKRSDSKQRKRSVDKVSTPSSASSSPATSKMSKNDKASTESDRPAAVKNKTKRQSSPIPEPVTPLKKIKIVKQRTYKPFHKLLEGVVLVISGIQNPARANIRQQALDMGAKYKPDWESSCTHLICAFKNTPKYTQVHGHGKIITKDWITECHKRKMRMPWRRYALDSDDANASESEDEIFDKSLQPSEPPSQCSNEKKSTQPKSEASSPLKTSKSPSKTAFDDDMNSDNDSLDRYNLNSTRPERNRFVSSGSDTEDEIRRVIEKKAAVAVTVPSNDSVTKSSSSDDIYNATTEEEGSIPTPKSESIAPLPEFYKGKRFYLSRNVSSTDELKLKRFISVYGGEVTLLANESDYILSNAPKATPSEYKGEVVKPLWVFECNELEALLPTRRYNFSDF